MHRLNIATLAILVALPHATHAQEPSPLQMPTVLTSGEAIVRRAPDQAFVTIAVETRARTPRDAQQQNADAMNAVQQRIAKVGIPRDAVRTTGYSIQQEFDFPNGRRTPRGYLAHNGVEVRVDAVERVGELLDAMVDAGATTVAGVRFDLKDRGGVEREALRQAVVDARARADAMAAGAGRTIDRVLRLTDRVESRFGGSQPMLMERVAMAAPAEPTPVQAGEIEVHARVELTALLK